MQFIQGIQYTLKGIRLFYSDKSLWRYSLIPMGIMLGVYILIVWGCIKLALSLADRLNEMCNNLPAWLSWIGSCVGTFSFLLGILTAGILIIATVTSLYEFFGGFFFDKLIEAVERKYFSKKTVISSTLKNMLFAWDAFLYGMKTVAT